VKGSASGTGVAIDSFVEDSQDSLPEYSVRRLPQNRLHTGSGNTATQLASLPVPVAESTGPVDDVDEEDKYNLLESTEELELPRRLESVDEVNECDVTIVRAGASAATAWSSSVANNESVVTDHSNLVTPLPVSPPVISHLHTRQTVSEERRAPHDSPHRLASLPTFQLDGQLDTPATVTSKQSSAVERVIVMLYISSSC